MYLVARPAFALLSEITSPRRELAGLSRMTAGASGNPTGTPGGDEEHQHARLLAGMAHGDRTALAGLYDALARPLYSLAYRVTRDATESQDILQEVFVQLWSKAGVYESSRGSVFSWAATLTRNRAIDRVRMRRRRGELLAGAAEELQPSAPAGATDSAGSLWVSEKAGAVRTALAQLAPEQQAAIELAFFSGLTQQEIAARLNEPLGTIKARIRRGLLRLRETLPGRL